MPIFTYVPGDRSPPPAPKHATAASTKPRVPRAAPQQRRAPAAQSEYTKTKPGANKKKLTGGAVYAHGQDYDRMDTHGDTPDNDTVASESVFDDYDASQYTNSRKKRRVEDPMTQADREHQLWADELLDYFMLRNDPIDAMPIAPLPPANANLNRPIDERGHTALHWAAAMGDIEVVKDLIRRGASIDVQAKNGETPLMRSAIFTNCFDHRNMEKVAGLLIRTVNMQEWLGSTVFHHIAGITQSKKKYECARYYLDCILNKMAEVLSPDSIERILNEQDNKGDTAITIAARNGARKCVRSLIGRNAAVDVANNIGETADQLIVQLNHRRQERNSVRQLSSSPFQADGITHAHPAVGGAVQPPSGGIPFDPLVPHSSLNGGIPNGTAGDVYKSEAALTLTSQIMPVLFTKAKSLAASLDAEIAEKDAELAEAERVAAMRRSEIEQLKRQAEELRIKELEQTAGGTQSDEQLLNELEELERECEGLTEAEQAFALKELLAAEHAKNTDGDPMQLDGATSSPAEEVFLREKLALARELATLSRQRKELVKQIVSNLSVAGLGDKQGEYKRLITGALGVREEDVEGMLPEIVAELEDWRGLETVGA